MRKLFFVALAFLSCAAISRADTYVITASGEFDNYLFNPAQFSGPITFTTQFDIDSVTHDVIPGTMTYSSTGQLGPLTLTTASYDIWDWSNAAGNFIQIDFVDHDLQTLPFFGEYGGGSLFLVYTGQVYAADSNGTVSVEPASEGPTSGLLLLSIAALLIIHRRRCKNLGPLTRISLWIVQ